MIQISFSGKCPHCRSREEHHVRVLRSAFMRFMPFSRHFFCTSCRKGFLTFFRSPPVKENIRRAKMDYRLWHNTFAC